MPVLSLTMPFLAQIGRTLPDTILTRQVAADLGIFQKIGIVGSTILAIAVLLLALGFLVGILQFRKLSQDLHQLFDRVYGDLNPILRNAGLVSDDVREITTTVKGNVRQVEQTVASANTRLQNAVRDTEGQIRRFNNFLGVVQDEAESAFVSTASTVRGVRTSVESLLDHNDEEFDDVDAPPEPQRQKPRIRTRENERFSRS